MTTTPGSLLSTRSLVRLTAPALAVALLAACGGGSASTSSSGTSTTAAAATSPAATTPSLTDAWVKASASGMTAVFGTLTNPTGQEITVVSATTPAATTVELHEVAMVDGAMKMRPKAGGFVVPAGGTHELKPGGDHVMLMGLTKPLVAGDSITLTLRTKDGRTIIVTALVKDFAAGNESYAPSGSAGASMSGSMATSPSASS